MCFLFCLVPLYFTLTQKNWAILQNLIHSWMVKFTKTPIFFKCQWGFCKMILPFLRYDRCNFSIHALTSHLFQTHLSTLTSKSLQVFYALMAGEGWRAGHPGYPSPLPNQGLLNYEILNHFLVLTYYNL